LSTLVEKFSRLFESAAQKKEREQLETSKALTALARRKEMTAEEEGLFAALLMDADVKAHPEAYLCPV